MKKTFTFLLIAGLMSTAAFAQNSQRQRGNGSYPSPNNPRDNSYAYDNNSGYGEKSRGAGRNSEYNPGYSQDRFEKNQYRHENNRNQFRDGYYEPDHYRNWRERHHGRGHNRFRMFFNEHNRW